MIVIDASVLFHLLTTPQDDPHVLKAAEKAGKFYAPHIVDAEVLNSLRRNLLIKKITEAQGERAIADLGDFAIERWPVAPFTDRIWELRHNLSAYDASYVALSEMLGLELYTRDKGIKLAPGHKAKVVVL